MSTALHHRRLPCCIALIWLIAAGLPATAEPAGGRDHSPYFRIDVVDQSTGRGIPGVRLAMSETSGVIHITDSAGVIAFWEPGLIETEVYFRVAGDGYVIDPAEGDQQGVTLRIKPGGHARIPLRRELAAQRIYRIGGLDPYRQSRLLNDAPAHASAPLGGKFVGQDSAFVTRYADKLFWVWGDTTGLGRRGRWNFEVAGATSRPPDQGGLDPDVGVDLNYFLQEDGFARPMVAAACGGTLTWFDGLVTLGDTDERERLFALYVQMRRVPKSKPWTDGEANHLVGAWWPDDQVAREVEIARRRELGEEAVRAYVDLMDASDAQETRVTRGLMEFDPQTKYFRRVATFPAREIDELHIGSHAVRVTHGETEFVYFSGLAPNRRVPADVESIGDFKRYQSFTCLKEGTRFDGQAGALDRDKDGALSYDWKHNTSPIGPREQATLLAAGHLRPDERWFVLRDVRTGTELGSQHHSIQWNSYRQRYVGLFTCHPANELIRAGGQTTLSTTWYGEADTIMGPWGYVEKVVDLGDYAYYNPLHNPYFNQHDGRVIYFEGTYTEFLGGGVAVRPRYNYNQVMHKLDLDDPRVVMPVVVYSVDDDARQFTTLGEIPSQYAGPKIPRFFAPDRPRPGCVPVYEVRRGRSFELVTPTTSASVEPSARLAFYAKPADSPRQDGTSTPLFACRNPSGDVRYVLDHERLPDGFRQDAAPVCCVWELTTQFNPWDVVDMPAK